MSSKKKAYKVEITENDCEEIEYVVWCKGLEPDNIFAYSSEDAIKLYVNEYFDEEVLLDLEGEIFYCVQIDATEQYKMHVSVLKDLEKLGD